MKTYFVKVQAVLMPRAYIRCLIACFLIMMLASASYGQQGKRKPVLKGGANDAPALFINPDGNVGIGVPDPQSKLQLGGDLRMNGNSIYFKTGSNEFYDFIRWSSPGTATERRDDKLDIAGIRGVRIGDSFKDFTFFPILTVGRTFSFNNELAPTPAVDIKSQPRTGTHPNSLAMYITGDFGQRGHGVEFRTNDAKKGLGFDFESIYTAGTDLQDIRLDVSGDKNLRFHTNGKEQLRIDGAGNIWTNGNGIYFRGGFGDKNQFIKWRQMDNAADGDITHDRLQIGGWNGVEIGSTRNYGGTKVTINANGFIGLGTTTPEFPIHVTRDRGAGNWISGKEYTYYGESGANNRSYANVGILAIGHIVTHNALIGAWVSEYSDIRLKKNIKPSSSVDDLARLKQIAVVDYKMIDTITDNKRYKKVVAQQLQKVYPDAIDITFKTLPDVYQHSTHITQLADSLYTITLANASKVKAGDVLELRCSDNADVNVNVISVSDGGRVFTVKSRAVLTGQKDVFVFGHPATDVLAVDYDAISMLNVSATQQLAKLIDGQQKEIARLRDRNAKLEEESVTNKTAISLVMERLSRLEAGKTSVTQPVLTASANR